MTNFSNPLTPSIHKNEQQTYCLKAIESANTWQASRHPTPIPLLCGRHKCTVLYSTVFGKTHKLCKIKESYRMAEAGNRRLW